MNDNNEFPKFITVAGSLASGKSTLARNLAKQMGYEFIGEEFGDNPFLADALTGEKSFVPAEEWFIDRDFTRYQRALDMIDSGYQGVVLDKPPWQNFPYISKEHMKGAEKLQCMRILKERSNGLRMPDLLIEVQAEPELLFDWKELRLQNETGRDFEKKLTLDWFTSWLAHNDLTRRFWPQMHSISVHAGYRDFRKLEDVGLLINDIGQNWKEHLRELEAEKGEPGLPLA